MNLKKGKVLKLYPEQIVVAISLLTTEEKKKVARLVPDIARYARFQRLEVIREKNKDISPIKVQLDVDKSIRAIRTIDTF